MTDVGNVGRWSELPVMLTGEKLLHAETIWRCPILVLSRHCNESVVITAGGEQIKIFVVDIRGDKARLGFEASKSIKIHRQEVQDAIDRDGQRKPA